MTWNVQPEPTDESERQALLAAVERGLEEEAGGEAAYASAWWRSGFDDLGAPLRGGAVPEQPGGQTGVVEP